MSDKIKYPKKPQSRLATIICDLLPDFGKIKQHNFTTSYGAGLTFDEAQEIEMNGVRQGTFTIKIKDSSPLWSSSELRELAEECIEMAKYLEKRAGTKAV